MKQTLLTIDEFIKYQNNWKNKHNEFYKKYDDLPEKYPSFGNDYAVEVNKLLNDYREYISEKTPDVYCRLTKDYCINNIPNKFYYLIGKFNLIGKEVKMNTKIIGVLMHIVKTIDGYYYIINNNDNIVWINASIDLIEK